MATKFLIGSAQLGPAPVGVAQPTACGDTAAVAPRTRTATNTAFTRFVRRLVDHVTGATESHRTPNRLQSILIGVLTQ